MPTGCVSGSTEDNSLRCEPSTKIVDPFVPLINSWSRHSRPLRSIRNQLRDQHMFVMVRSIAIESRSVRTYDICSCLRVCRGGARVVQTRYGAASDSIMGNHAPEAPHCGHGIQPPSVVEWSWSTGRSCFSSKAFSLCSGYLSIDIELNVRLQSFHQLLVRRSQPLRRPLDKHVTRRLNALKGVMPDWIFDIFCVIAAEGRASLMRQARGRRAEAVAVPQERVTCHQKPDTYNDGVFEMTGQDARMSGKNALANVLECWLFLRILSRPCLSWSLETRCICIAGGGLFWVTSRLHFLLYAAVSLAALLRPPRGC